MTENIWKLKHADELIGEIHITDSDFPWLCGTFVASPGFAHFKPLFDRELELMESDNPGAEDAMDSWEKTYELINNALTLIDAEGMPVAEFLLHIQNGDAWFRWSDEPFGE